MQITINEKIIPVKIVYKNIKNVYMRFDEEGTLVVSARRLVSKNEIARIINSNQKSLEKMYLKWLAKEQKRQEIWLLGEKYEWKKADSTYVRISENYVLAKNLKDIEIWIRSLAEKIFLEEVNKVREVIDTPDFLLKIRQMKSRWGVCNFQKKIITLNLELIKYKRELIRYVIVHEMCHFEHHNHGKSFWLKVEQYYPNYKQARKELR